MPGRRSTAEQKAEIALASPPAGGHELIGKLAVENEALKRGRHWLKK